MAKITTDDWLGAMAQAHNRGRLVDGRSVREIATALGMCTMSVQRMCRKKVAAGEWRQGWDYRETSTGNQRRVPVYAPIRPTGRGKTRPGGQR